MRVAVALAAVMLALLPACGPSLSGQPTPVPPSPTSLSPLPTLAPLGDDVLSVYNRSGCFTGVNDTRTVHQQGGLELVDRLGTLKRAQIAPNGLQALKQLLSSPAYAALVPLYQAVGADLCVYRITARDAGGRPHMVATHMGPSCRAFAGRQKYSEQVRISRRGQTDGNHVALPSVHTRVSGRPGV